MKLLLLSILLLLGASVAQDSLRGRTNTTKMCAVLNLYKKDPAHCQGKPSAHQMKIPCLDGPGSPCGSDPNDPQHVSVKDVYCDDHGFYETVYRGSDDCNENASQKIYVRFPKDECKGGHMFVSCLPGPCQHTHEEGEVLFAPVDGNVATSGLSLWTMLNQPDATDIQLNEDQVLVV